MVVQKITTPNGATVRIHNDYCAPKGSEQERRIIEQQRRVAQEILVSAASARGAHRMVRLQAAMAGASVEIHMLGKSQNPLLAAK